MEDLNKECRKQWERLYEVMYSSAKISDLTIVDFCRIIREIVKEEINRTVPIYEYKVPTYEYKVINIPRTPGELNEGNTNFYTTNSTEFNTLKFPVWNHGYKENK